jgi:opacity protein-like surface antigen
MKSTLIATGLLTLAVAGSTLAADIVERDTVRRTLKFGAPGDRRVLVDNVNGSINVVGYDGNAVELVAYRKIRAESERRLEEAKSDVTLDVKEEPDRILVYVDAPWRRSDGSVNYRGWEYYGYDVEYDFELRVPSKVDCDLKTVNSGDIDVRGMKGSFDVHNVNGAVEMREIAGSGRASTVNGDISVSFTENPRDESSFKTINGEIELKFPSAPSADLRFKTLNGEVYTDFDVKSLPNPVSAGRRRNGRFVYGGGDSFMVRAGDGGPGISCSTLNGDIYLSLKGDKQ